MAMGYYIAFAAICAVLALLYLNRGKGSSALYPSLSTVLTFAYIMWSYAKVGGFGFENAVDGCSSGIVCGFIVYWLAVFVRNSRKKSLLRRGIALVLCVVGWPVSLPAFFLGKGALLLFREVFAQANAQIEQERLDAAQRQKEKEERQKQREAEVLEWAQTDDDLCRYFAELYSRMGYAPQIARVGEDGPLRIFLQIGNESYAFVAVAGTDVLDEDKVEWAAQFRGEAKKAGLVTTGTFSKRAVWRAERLRVALVDLPNLPKIMRAARRAERRALLGR